jgi:NADPH2:quinone reductase
MKAAFCTELGGPEVLQVGEVETPEPGAGEVRVRVHASGVNPSDWKARYRGRGGGMGYNLIIPHSDGAGVVDKVGSGVSGFEPGQRVWVLNAQYLRPLGTAAEYVVLPQNLVFPLPDGADFNEGACFGIPFLTAHRALTMEGDIKGQTVLIQGGAGAVGHHLIQIAKRLGATVLTTVSSDEKAAYATEAGADHALIYTDEDYVAGLLEATDGAGVDRIIEVNLSGNGLTYGVVLKPCGTVIIYGTNDPVAQVPAMDFIRRGATLKWFIVYEINDAQRQAGAAMLNDMVSDSGLVTTIAKTFPLDEVQASHEMVEAAKHIGNVVLEIP